MEHKLSDRAKPRDKKILFNSNAPKNERVILAGDFNSCVLVIPEVFGMGKNIGLYQGRFHEYPL